MDKTSWTAIPIWIYCPSSYVGRRLQKQPRNTQNLRNSKEIHGTSETAKKFTEHQKQQRNSQNIRNSKETHSTSETVKKLTQESQDIKNTHTYYFCLTHKSPFFVSLQVSLAPWIDEGFLDSALAAPAAPGGSAAACSRRKRLQGRTTPRGFPTLEEGQQGGSYWVKSPQMTMRTGHMVHVGKFFRSLWADNSIAVFCLVQHGKQSRRMLFINLHLSNLKIEWTVSSPPKSHMKDISRRPCQLKPLHYIVYRSS